MEHNERIPGVTLHLKEATESQPLSGGRYRGAIELLADITDLDIWNAVAQKLDGMRIYTVSNLSESMIEVSQRKARKAEEELRKQGLESSNELEQLRAALSLLNAELNQAKAVNRQLVVQLKAFEVANKKWEEWAQTTTSAPPQGKIEP